MRALIDKSVPFAHTYYTTYLAEPSPAGDIGLSPDDITTVDHMSLEKLLTEMKDVGTSGELLVITHSSPTGFLMTLKPGGRSSLLFSVMGKMLQISEGIRRHDAIQSMPAAQQPEAWRKWIQEFDPGFKLGPDFQTNPDWQKNLEDAFDSWIQVQGTVVLKLPGGGKDLRPLLDLLNDVRKLGFTRIEFRACDLGADPDAMKTIANFLQVKTVVGPKNVQTFYGSFVKAMIAFAPGDAKFEFAFKKMGGRKFGSSVGILMLPHGFRILAQDQNSLKDFVNKFINAAFKGNVIPFVVGGLDSVGKTTTKYVFPLEAEYKTLIDRFDA